MLSKTRKEITPSQDPVGLYKTDQIDMVPTDCADITLTRKTVGPFEELLTWRLKSCIPFLRCGGTDVGTVGRF